LQTSRLARLLDDGRDDVIALLRYNLGDPLIARLIDSVPPEVKTSSSGRGADDPGQLLARASTPASASQPKE